MTSLLPRRALASVLAAAVLGGAGSAYAAASASSHDDGHQRTIVLTEQTAELKPIFVDLGKPGPSVGDRAVIRDGLLAQDGADAGVLTQDCVLTDTAATVFECTGSLALADGTITVAGPFSPTAAEQPAAITGGTGAFRSARGEVVARAEADEFVVRLAR